MCSWHTGREGTPQSSPQEGLQPIIELSDELEAECALLLPPVSTPGTQNDSLPSDPLHATASPLRDQRRSRRGNRGHVLTLMQNPAFGGWC